MSQISEWWSGANDVQRGIGVASAFTVLGMTTAEGRKGFAAGPIQGIGGALGKGIYMVGSVPVTFLKSIAEGVGIKQLAGDVKDTKVDLGKIDPKDLQGLYEKYVGDGGEAEKKAGLKDTLILVGVVLAALLVIVLIVKALK